MPERPSGWLPALDTAPLRGVRVVELGWVVAGTLPGMFLADLGAEVVKVESRHRIDLNRQVPPLNDDWPAYEQSPRFHNLNRGKLGLTVDLSAPESREVLQRLVAGSQVVIENFSPGVLSRLGLGYEQLTHWRPDLIMASITAVGQDGPWSEARGYALTVGAMAGFSSLVGYDDGPPLGDEFMCPDVVASLHATVALLAALHHHRRTGEGQYIDVSMYEAMAAVLAEPLLIGSVAGDAVPPMDVHDPSYAPHGIFRCAGEDSWVAISVTDDAAWRALCAVLSAGDLAADRALATLAGRQAQAARLEARITAWTGSRDKHQAARLLQQAGIAAAPVLDLGEHVDDLNTDRAGVYQDIAHPALGNEPIIATPWSSDPPFAGPQGRAPLLGEHNEYVLCTMLGFSADEYRDLVERGTLT